MDKDNSESTTPQDAKGKGIATKIDNLSSESTAQDGHSSSVGVTSDAASFISRLSASAGKLTNEMVLQHPSGASLADVLPSDKSESSRSGRSAGVNETSIFRNNFAQGTIPDTFKSIPRQEQTIPSESGFSSFLSSTSMLGETDPSGIKIGRYRQIHEPALGETQQTRPIISTTDGMDVVNFLDLGYDEVEEIDMALTDTEQAALRHRLFENGESGEHASRGRWDDALNFFPGLGPNSNSIQEYADLLGTSDLEEAKNIWVNQWQGVLSSYTDEVWGELGSLVKVAREELTNISEPHEEASPSKLKAVRRLQQLLSHIRGTRSAESS
ncbi:hypothetical protein F4813DRAFT_361645 [Daldinia decipiens]|uniref:uncharacterized protein n=1 Tax=Daldinia decipiens TaxID=326647 RepID=UPI0020C1DAE3|nr:uncharacterized protein F4813DRAFT_361645 [Daldinia decipiens]KAI1657103.1 hypothetical protein F4813DRAFT_361645 [Daldinia decipiens]